MKQILPFTSTSDLLLKISQKTLTKMASEQHHYSVFAVNSEHISRTILVLLLLTASMYSHVFEDVSLSKKLYLPIMTLMP